MFKLTQEDLRIAKPLANVFIVSFIAIGIAFGTENFELLGLLQGFFPILAIIFLYYSLKLLTAQERSLMFILLEHISLLVYIISLHFGVINQFFQNGVFMRLY